MLFFVDTCFLVALYDKNDDNHDSACDIWKILLEKKMIKGYNNFFMSDYILTEMFHRLQTTIGFRETLNCFYKITKTGHVVKAFYPETIEKAIKLKLLPFCNHKTKKPRIGLVDATSLVIMEENNIHNIISFDEHFKNIPFVFPIYDTHQLKCLI